MQVSIVTTTIRGEKSLIPVLDSLKQQILEPDIFFEWHHEIHDPSLPPDFNQSMNRLIRKCTGELVVFIQDYIWIPPTGIQQFVDLYKKNKMRCYTAPVGKTVDNLPIDVDNPTIIWDWRKDRSLNEECNFMEWEIDYAACPLKMLYDIGGFDEELDRFWGFDNVSLGSRLVDNGYHIHNVPYNKAVAYNHNLFIKHPYQPLRNPDFFNSRLSDIIQGEVKVSYLEGK